jgi:hypothetical protein
MIPVHNVRYRFIMLLYVPFTSTVWVCVAVTRMRQPQRDVELHWVQAAGVEGICTYIEAGCVNDTVRTIPFWHDSRPLCCRLLETEGREAYISVRSGDFNPLTLDPSEVRRKRYCLHILMRTESETFGRTMRRAVVNQKDGRLVLDCRGRQRSVQDLQPAHEDLSPIVEYVAHHQCTC